MERSADELVSAMLVAAGLSPSSEEQAELTSVYPVLRKALDALYTASESSDTYPAAVFGVAGTYVGGHEAKNR